MISAPYRKEKELNSNIEDDIAAVVRDRYAKPQLFQYKLTKATAIVGLLILARLVGYFLGGAGLLFFGTIALAMYATRRSSTKIRVVVISLATVVGAGLYAAVVMFTFAATMPSLATLGTEGTKAVAVFALYSIKCEPVPKAVELKMERILKAMTEQERTETTNYAIALSSDWETLNTEAQKNFCSSVKPDVELMSK
jgi:hypothetical protein